MPFVSPVNVYDRTLAARDVQFVPSRLTRYPVAAEPPSLVGGCQFIVAVEFPALAVTLVGASGKFLGVTAEAVAIL